MNIVNHINFRSWIFREYLYLLKNFFLGILLSLGYSPVIAQLSSEQLHRAATIADNLEQEGFQSIDISQINQSSNLVIAYENNRYRFDALGLQKVIELTNEILKDKVNGLDTIIFITKRNNIPIVSTRWNRSNNTGKIDKQNFSFSRDIKHYKFGQSIVNNQNTSNFRAELVLRPFLTMELGNLILEDQFIHLIDLRPKLNIYLWKGAHFTSEFILPISNEFKTQAPHWGVIRTRVVSFTQQVRLPHSTFLSTSIGLFSRNRYGISTQVGKYFWKDRLWATAKVGYTGHASYVRFTGLDVEKNWLYTPLHYLDYKIGLNYWFPKWNLQIAVDYGKVLSDVTAVFFSCKQKFKETELEFYAFRTKEGSNYGLEVAIPIFPKKYWKPRRFNIRPTKKFRYNYHSGRRGGQQVPLAREYQAQGMYEDFSQDLNPYFLSNYIFNDSH